MPKIWNEQEVYMRMTGFDMAVSYDANGRQQYVGFAYPGALISEAKWQIFKLSYDANGRQEKRRYANKSDEFNKIFDNRTSYDFVDI